MQARAHTARVADIPLADAVCAETARRRSGLALIPGGEEGARPASWPREQPVATRPGVRHDSLTGATPLVATTGPNIPAQELTEPDRAELSARVAPSIRATGVLVEDGALLLEHMVLRERSHWTLPGGKLEYGETLQQCLAREMREETGLAVEVGELLYVCDRFHGLGSHVVDMSFLVRRAGSSRLAAPLPATDDGIASVEMVPFDQLEARGFSGRFTRLVRDDFPGRGSYCGEFHAFYG